MEESLKIQDFSADSQQSMEAHRNNSQSIHKEEGMLEGDRNWNLL